MWWFWLIFARWTLCKRNQSQISVGFGVGWIYQCAEEGQKHTHQEFYKWHSLGPLGMYCLEHFFSSICMCSFFSLFIFCFMLCKVKSFLFDLLPGIYKNVGRNNVICNAVVKLFDIWMPIYKNKLAVFLVPRAFVVFWNYIGHYMDHFALLGSMLLSLIWLFPLSVCIYCSIIVGDKDTSKCPSSAFRSLFTSCLPVKQCEWLILKPYSTF